MGDISQAGSKHDMKLSFQSKELEGLLDVIDNLRLQGITGYIDLPQLIVCGDQSSGKSSVLEALSGVQFPMKDNLCTRYPTEVILRRKPAITTTITIVPDQRRSEEEKQKLLDFKAGDDALLDFGATVEAAGKLMGLEDNVRAFSTDILRVELTGPTLPHLTLVDLPGLFHSGNKTQSDNDAQIVKDLIMSYMDKQRSIILAVVSAKNDYANQVVTKHARDVDPRGERTLGIITKPDLLDEGSSSEKQYFEMVQNTDVVLRLGWHVLKNRDYKSRNCSMIDRDAAEAMFFSKGIWSTLSHSQYGIESLKKRLSCVLRDHIKAELPSLTEDVLAGVKQCESRLEQLGASRATPKDQRKYLHQISQTFAKIIQSAIAGYYNDQYFDESSSVSYPKRIRAVVANRLEDFSTTMYTKGNQFSIVKGPIQETVQTDTPIRVTRQDRIERVAELIKETRGRELPGFTKFETVTTLFKEQCQPWETHIKSCTEDIYVAVVVAIHLALDETCDQSTKTGILRFLINPAMENIKQDLVAKVQQNLQQHVRGHPITLNHYFTDNVQKLRNDHYAEFLEPKLRQYLSAPYTARDNQFHPSITIAGLTDTITNNTLKDMTEFACSEALYFMEAYYKVALKFFMDDFCIHTVEEGLMAKLEAVFNPSTVLALTETEIEKIAGESEGSVHERVGLSTKLAALQDAVKILRQLDGGRTFMKPEEMP